MGDEHMSNLLLTVNDRVEFNGEAVEWQHKTPDMFRDVIKPDAKPQPWMMATMITLTQTLLADQSVEINVKHRSNRWSIKVEYL